MSKPVEMRKYAKMATMIQVQWWTRRRFPAGADSHREKELREPEFLYGFVGSLNSMQGRGARHREEAAESELSTGTPEYLMTSSMSSGRDRHAPSPSGREGWSAGATTEGGPSTG